MSKISSFFYKIRKRIKRWWYTKQNLGIIASCKEKPKVNRPTQLSRSTHLGKNCNFNGMKVVGRGKLIIGDNFHSGEDILIITENHDFDNGEAIPYCSKRIYKDVIIEDNVWIGSRVIILGGVAIGEGAIIQAGSVVTDDIPKYGIAGGHPAKVFRTRDIDHYEKLKAEKKFH